MQSSHASTPSIAWAAFAGVVVIMLALDLFISRREKTASVEQSRRVSLYWTIAWAAAGLGFGVFIWFLLGSRAAQEYFAAYAMEEGLSLDNMFLFYVIFQSLSIPGKFQHKVLFWGVLGAVVFRGIFIFVGISALDQWRWVTYVFAFTLFYAAWRAFKTDPTAQEKSRIVEFLSRHLPLSQSARTGDFFEIRGGHRVATPMLVALIAIELTDIVFAIDSVPATLSITHDRFIVYSSNILAVLGLRSLYLYLASTISGLRFLHYGLAAVLAFAALKIGLGEWVPIPPLVSIGVVATLIGGSVWASLRLKRRHHKTAAEEHGVA